MRAGSNRLSCSLVPNDPAVQDGAPPEALARLIDSIAEHRPGQLFRAVNMTDPGQPTTAPSTSPSV